MNSDMPEQRYGPPKLNKLPPEKAKQFLEEQAAQGDQGAKDLLAVLSLTSEVL
jgi:hypothetical protein